MIFMLRVYDIDWDTDGEEVDLPTELLLGNELPDEVMEDYSQGYTDELADYLSDTYGFCLYGFRTEIVAIDSEGKNNGGRK